MTTPSGSPAWLRTNDAQTYGGHPNKRNYQAQGVVNPLTDVDAADFQRLTADLASLQRVAPFCVLTVKCNDTTPAAPTVQRIQQMSAVSLAGYPGASPTHPSFPTLARTGVARFTVTWPTNAEDDYEVEGAIDLAHVTATVIGATGYMVAVVNFLDSRTLEVRLEDGSGDEFEDGAVTIEVA